MTVHCTMEEENWLARGMGEMGTDQNWEGGLIETIM
jgi:hypothetical protein